MPGRYTDELRRITRKQMGDTPSADGGTPEPQRGQRSPYVPVLVAAIILTLVGIGWWIVQQMAADSKLQDCVMSGRKNCAPLQDTAPGR